MSVGALQLLTGSLGSAALDRVPLRRPRFTASEILILNELVNRSPKPVTARRLQKLLQGYSSRSYPITPDTTRQHIANLRAKLGEQSRKPTLIVTVYVEHPNGGPELAYRYSEE